MDKVVWLIDDDESIRESLTFLLSGMGWQVKAFESVDAFTLAHGGETALVGCLLLDMRMPGKSGLAWLEEGEWPWPLLPVVIMTGHGTVDACRRAFRNGVFEFFTKPWMPTGLSKRLAWLSKRACGDLPPGRISRGLKRDSNS